LLTNYNNQFVYHDIKLLIFLFRYIKKQVYKDGHTGKVAFDNNGDRIYAEYDIVNVKEVGNKDAIGKYYFNNVNE